MSPQYVPFNLVRSDFYQIAEVQAARRLLGPCKWRFWSPALKRVQSLNIIREPYSFFLNYFSSSTTSKFSGVIISWRKGITSMIPKVTEALHAKEKWRSELWILISPVWLCYGRKCCKLVSWINVVLSVYSHHPRGCRSRVRFDVHVISKVRLTGQKSQIVGWPSDR